MAAVLELADIQGREPWERKLIAGSYPVRRPNLKNYLESDGIMKRYDTTIEYDEYNEPYVVMSESKYGKYVLTEEAMIEAGYVWDYKTADWIKHIIK